MGLRCGQKGRHAHVVKKDIDDRGLVIVGYVPSELFPPYHDENHEQRAREILDYAESFPKSISFRAPIDISDSEIKTQFPDNKVIEVVGGSAGICVLAAIFDITTIGATALVESRRTFSLNSSHADFTLGKMILRGMLGYGIKKCMIIGREKYLFYNSVP